MKKTLLLIVILTIFFNGCVGLTQTDTSNQNSWRTGTQGIVMNFVPNNPPSEVVSSSEVLVYVEYANRGATDATELEFHLTGYDNSILSGLGGPDNSYPRTLGGKTRFNTEGSQVAFVEWSSGINMGSMSNTDSFKQAVVATACYKYGTIAYPQMCIDPTQFDVIGPSECDYSVKWLGASQGGPIAVTRVDKKMSKNKIFLEIEFQNKGNGNPYISAAQGCLNLQYKEIDKIYVKSVGNGGFTCNPRDIRLVNNKGITICESNSNFHMPQRFSEIQLPIILEYRYRESLPKKEITIVNVGN